MAKTEQKSLAKLAGSELSMLGVAFLLGMGVNLIGLPDETTGGAKAASMALLGLHVLVGIGVIVVAALIGRRALKQGGVIAKLGRLGGASIGLGFISGILTVATHSNWWSYLMAVCFLAAVFIYGKILLITNK